MNIDDDQYIKQGNSKHILVEYSSKTCTFSCSPSLKSVIESNPKQDTYLLNRSIRLKRSKLLISALEINQILHILTHRNSIQKEKIKLIYYETYSKHLMEHIKSILPENMEYITMCLLYTRAGLDAYILHESLKNLNIQKREAIQKNHTIIHIFCTRSHEQLTQIEDSYQKLFHRTLREDIISIMIEDVKKILIELLDKIRHNNPPNIELATSQSDWIYSMKLSKNLPDDLTSVFANASYENIIAFTEIFQQKTGIALSKFLARYAGLYEYTIKTICQYAVNPIEYYATFLKACITSSNWRGIVCVLTTRAEIDLQCILKAFNGLYRSEAEAKIKPIFKCKKLVYKTLHMLCGSR